MRKNAAERKDSDPRLNIPELKTAAQVWVIQVFFARAVAWFFFSSGCLVSSIFKWLSSCLIASKFISLLLDLSYTFTIR